MIRFRYIYISRLILQLLRPNYALRHDYSTTEQPERLNGLYRYLLAILSTLSDALKDYYQFRLRWYMIAACEPTYGHIGRVLSKLYGDDVWIETSTSTSRDTYLYVEDTPARYLYTGASPSVYWGRTGVYESVPVVHIPQSLADDTIEYNKFIADLNLLIPFYVGYTIHVD